MTSLVAILGLGFLLGLRHAADADHVVAVTTIVTRQRSAKAAGLIGLAWGLGHTLTILVVGGAIVLFEWVMPPRLGLALELGVAAMLIVLGIRNLAGKVPGHHHEVEAEPVGRLDRRLGALAGYRLARPLLIGVVHGLAGSAAVALLVLTAIRDPAWSLLYLAVFGLGTIVGMGVVTAVIAASLAIPAARIGGFDRGLRLAAGALSVALGLFIAYQIGVVDGLFSDSPRWSPH